MLQLLLRVERLRSVDVLLSHVGGPEVSEHLIVVWSSRPDLGVSESSSVVAMDDR